MSTNGNGWKPRKPEKWTCPSGQEVLLRPPGPEFTLRLGRSPRTFSGDGDLPKRKPGQTDEEFHKEMAEHISDDDLVAVARDLLVAMVESPKLVLNPDSSMGEMGPDDTGLDFWPLYNYGMHKYFARKVAVGVGTGEVEVTDLETFPQESGVSGDGVDGVHVPVAEPEPTVADPRLVGSAGA